ncbi:MAG: hypothetical protein CEE40_10050, partial [Chloroflexi bacterium B3_Chlor]
LLHEELSSAQEEMVNACTRLGWTRRFFANFVMPAATGVPATLGFMSGRPLTEPPPHAEPPEEQIIHEFRVAHFGQVLPIDDVEQVLDMVDSITRMPCGCRFIHTGKTDKRYCFGLAVDKWGMLGKFPDDASSLEVLEADEAKEIFRQYDEEGLMHSIWTGVTPYIVGICNCDRDCGAYKGYIEEGGPPIFFRAEYVCQTDWDLCTGCKDCMSQCQFGSQFYSSALEKVYIDPGRCYGCGVCRAVCPHDAIALIPRQEHPEAAEIWLR